MTLKSTELRKKHTRDILGKLRSVGHRGGSFHRFLIALFA